MQIVCPCIPFHRKQFDMKRCWCALFVHQDGTDPESLSQVSEKELGIA
jgi:ferredoxin-thioredoxin reductase catalytic subunit